MSSNLSALKMISILTMFISSIRCCTGLSKHIEYGMNSLEIFLLQIHLKVGKADPTHFTKTIDDDLFICQIYVDDIIFGSTN
jgi:hypothetical protein